MSSRRLLNLEFHAIDLADADADGFPDAVVRVQPDLRVSLATKQRRLRAALSRIAKQFEFATLADAATAFDPPPQKKITQIGSVP